MSTEIIRELLNQYKKGKLIDKDLREIVDLCNAMMKSDRDIVFSAKCRKCVYLYECSDEKKRITEEEGYCFDFSSV